MNLLLDTHAFLWWGRSDKRLGPTARAAIAKPENLVFVSAVSAWEIGVKRALGKLAAPRDVVEWIDRERFESLSITIGHAVLSAELPSHHRDPFDRLLVAQAQVEDLTLVTADAHISKYSVKLLDATA